MERKFLEDLGLQKEIIDKVMDSHSADIGKHKKAAEAANGERDALKSQLDEAVKSVEALKAKGADAEALNAVVAKLTKEIEDNKAAMSERDFQGVVKDSITALKGRNVKGIMANLDLDALRGSKNQGADIKAALEALQKSDGYLFDNGDKDTGGRMKISTGGSHEDGGGEQSANAVMNSLITGKSRGE